MVPQPLWIHKLSLVFFNVIFDGKYSLVLNGDFVMEVELEETRNKTVPIKVCFYVASIQK